MALYRAALARYHGCSRAVLKLLPQSQYCCTEYCCTEQPWRYTMAVAQEPAMATSAWGASLP